MLSYLSFIRLLLSALILCPLLSYAQENKKLTLDPNKPLRLNYFSRAWNKNPNLAETGILIFRDGESGRIARIEVTETEMDSSRFVGSYSISWTQGQEITPEIYVAPTPVKGEGDQNKKLEKLIADGVLLRKPYFLRPEDRRATIITVFDSREQAVSAYEEYRRQSQTKTNTDPTQGKNIVDPAALAAQEKLRLANELKAQADLAAKAEANRQQMAATEAKKQADLKAAQESMSAAEKARRKKEAQSSAERALAKFKSQDFKGAEVDFAKAVELDPDNKTFFYQYGVTLYKNENYNKSLVFLNLSDGDDVNLAEKEYFQALNYSKLKETKAAAEKFVAVRDKEDKTLSPTASFLLGIIEFQAEDYDSSKKSFEWVLDNSSDSKLDEQAESYIEQIANVLYYKKEQEKKFIITVNLGLMYDSNILAVSGSQIDAGIPTDLEGYRGSYGGSVEYRPIYTAKHEFSALLSLNDMYSWDKSFKAAPNFQNTDPMVLSFGLPYKYKGQAFSKPYFLGLTPSYETTNMNSDASGARELTMTSTVLKVDQTFVMNENWFSTYNLEFRSDTSKLPPAGDDDVTGNKITLNTSNSIFLDKKKTEAFTAELGASQSMVDGKNQDYTRIDLAASYLAPWKWDTSWSSRLGYYNANYSNHATGRKDDNISLSLGLRKPINEAWTALINANYSINKSTLTTSDYKKYLIMTVFSWNKAF